MTEPGLQAGCTPSSRTLTCGVALPAGQTGQGTFRAHERWLAVNAFVERVACALSGLGDQMAVKVDGGRDRLVAEPAGDLGDGHAFGEGGAGEATTPRSPTPGCTK